MLITTAAVWIVAISRAVPDRLGDRGIFVSVAEHLLRGGTLYVTTYDNKEPLFLYFVAMQRALGTWAEWLAEIVLVAVCAGSSYLLARGVSSARASLIVGVIIVPVIVTGVFYFPGATNLPATATTLAVLAAIGSGRIAVGGALAGMVLFMKIPAVPVVVASGTAMIVVRFGRWGILRFAAGMLVVGALLAGVMAWRGELLPFIQITFDNVRYAQGELVSNASMLWGMIAHIGRVWGRDFYTEVAAILFTFLLGVIASSPLRLADKNQASIIAACAASFCATIAALAMTGLWHHHNQLFYIAASLAAISIAKFIDLSLKQALLSTLVAGLCVAYLLGGAFPLRAHFVGLTSMSRNYAALNIVPPEAARLLSIGNSGTYARFGRYDERGHAIWLAGWRLACPRFHQGQHEPKAILDKVFDCASKIPILLIGGDFCRTPHCAPGIADDGANWPEWRAFVDRVELLLEKEYSCDATSGLRVCRRR